MTKKLSIHNDRHRITINGRRMLNAHYVWNSEHPEDPIKKGDGFVIHHKDENKLNDHPSNLEKMLDGKHRSLHSKSGVIALAKWRKENPEKAIELASNSAYNLFQKLRDNPVLVQKRDNNRNKAMSTPEYRKKMSESVKKAWARRKAKGGLQHA